MSVDRAQRLRVELGARSYEILIGADLLQQAGRELRALGVARAVVVTDSNVAGLHLDDLSAVLTAADISHESIVLPPGEETKCFAVLEDLTDRLLALGLDRRVHLIALGGGVIGDLVGFTASILLRGLDFVQVPTTLLAQVDSSVGGKTGIDTRHGKNLIGSFHQPRLVLADLALLRTLPRRELLCGYAEVVKYGLINDPAFFAWLEREGTKVLACEAGPLAKAVETSCRAKAGIVAADEREAGQRALLNLGHTFAHALEAQLAFSDALRHGEAVAIGLVLAFELSVRLGLCPAEDAERVRAHLGSVGLPTGLSKVRASGWSSAALLEHMRRDKKVKDGQVTFVLTRGIGKAFVSDRVAPEAVAQLLDRALAA